MSDPAIPEWAKRAADAIIPLTGAMMSDREEWLRHAERIIAAEYSAWLCERLNGLTFFASAKDIANAFSLDFDAERGFRPKGEAT